MEGSKLLTTKVLKEARRLLSQGWCQKVLVKSFPLQYCILGAINEASQPFGLLVSHDARQAVSRWVPDGVVSAYNDAEGRTQEEVLALMDRAITAIEKAVEEPTGND